MANNEQALIAVLALAEGFGKQLSDEALKIWLRVLRDVSDDELLSGADAVLRSARRFMPTPGEFRFACLLRGDSLESRALHAWGVAIGARRSAGPRDSVRFEDGLIGVVIRRLAGSWPEFCYRLRESGVDFLRRAFLDAYATLLEQECRDIGPAVMQGSDALCQSDWNRARYGIPAPIKIASPYSVPKALPAPSNGAPPLSIPIQQPEFAS